MADALASPLLKAFGRIRVAAEQVMDQQDLAGYDWAETTVTDMSIIAGEPEVRHAKFNQREEGGGVGADYLWWWLSSESSECFGMLVQAKPLRRARNGWLLDLSHNKGKQVADLLRTAAYFDVPAVYGVYTGGPNGRADGLHWLHDDAGDDPTSGSVPIECLRCRRMAISMVAALQVSQFAYSPRISTSQFLSGLVPLEDLADPDVSAGAILDLNLKKVTSEPLRQWLLDDQVGPREVAKKIFKALSVTRAGMFSAATAEPLTVAGVPVFAEVPQDTGHWNQSYFAHVLRGLQTEPPAYVRTFLDGEILPSEITDAVDGIVVVQGVAASRSSGVAEGQG